MISPNAFTNRSVKPGAAVALALALVACAPPRAPAPAPIPAPSAPAPAPAPVPAPPAATPAPAPGAARAPRRVQLAPPPPARSMKQVHRLAAERVVAAHPDETYMSTPPPILFAVPVLLVELKGDGSIRRVQVLRYPSDRDNHFTVQLAIDALHRAAPFGSVQHLPQPWTFTESYLFDKNRRFKPRSLD